MVLIGHFYDAFYGFDALSPDLNGITVSFFEYFPKPFLDGKFWVCVFCVISGVLASRKVVCSYKELFKEIILRYLRFLIPLFAANSIVYLLHVTVGFYNHQIGELYANSWLSGCLFNITFKAVIKNSILFGAELISPLWMLRPLFIGNITILISNFITNKYLQRKQHKYLFPVAISILLFGLAFIRESALYLLTTFCGLILYNTKKERYNTPLVVIILAVVIAFYNILIIGSVMTARSLQFMNALFSIMLVLILLSWKSAGITKSSKLPLGEMSFWVFLLHWPVICSFACFIVMKFNNYTLGYWIALLAALCIVCVLSFVFVKTIDKVTGWIVRKSRLAIDKLLRLN